MIKEKREEPWSIASKLETNRLPNSLLLYQKSSLSSSPSVRCHFTSHSLMLPRQKSPQHPSPPPYPVREPFNGNKQERQKERQDTTHKEQEHMVDIMEWQQQQAIGQLGGHLCSQ